MHEVYYVIIMYMSYLKYTQKYLLIGLATALVYVIGTKSTMDMTAFADTPTYPTLPGIPFNPGSGGDSGGCCGGDSI